MKQGWLAGRLVVSRCYVRRWKHVESCSELAIIIMAIALDCHDCSGWCFGTTVISNAWVDSLLLHNWRTLTSQVWAVGSVKLSGRCCKGLDKGLERFGWIYGRETGGIWVLADVFLWEGFYSIYPWLIMNVCERCTVQYNKYNIATLRRYLHQILPLLSALCTLHSGTCTC